MIDLIWLGRIRAMIGFGFRNRSVNRFRSSLILAWTVIRLNKNRVKALNLAVTNPLDHLLNILLTAHIASVLEIRAMFNVDTSP